SAINLEAKLPTSVFGCQGAARRCWSNDKEPSAAKAATKEESRYPPLTSPRGREERGHAIEMNSVSSNESTVRNLRKPRKLSRIGVQSSHRKDLFEFSALLCLKVFTACANCTSVRLYVN